MDVKGMTIQKARYGLDNGAFTAVELTQACLQRIKERNPEINAFVTVFEKNAIEEAKKADQRIGTGDIQPLTGIPFGVKDAICVDEQRSTASAKILDQYTPPFEATVISKIRRQGAIFLGKENCDAFGHGASTENSMYGVTKNPHDPTKVSGGSSGGSAAAVADGMTIFSIAEDTGGSIRQPASFCGVVGLRPSYGRNSRYGIMPMASSLDTVGPITKTVEDAAIVLEVMAGHDTHDATTVPDAVPIYKNALQKDLSGIRVGVPKEYFALDGLSSEVKDTTMKVIEQLQEKGIEIVDVSLPHTKYAIPTYYLLVPSEDSSNLARLDGIRYGERKDGNSLYEMYTHTRGQGFPAEVKRRIMVGTYALSSGYYDAYYRKAQKVRTRICEDFDRVFKDVDVLITPTSPFPAFAIGEKSSDPMAMYLADMCVSPASIAGVPGISINAGFSKEGLPIGVQLIAPRLQEERLFHIGSHIES